MHRKRVFVSSSLMLAETSSVNYTHVKWNGECKPFNAACFKIFAISLNSSTTSSTSSVFEVNRILQLSRSWASSRQTAITLAESSVVADKNAKFSTICFSRWKGSWYMLESTENACDCWLSFGLSGHSFNMYRRVIASIRLLRDAHLNIIEGFT